MLPFSFGPFSASQMANSSSIGQDIKKKKKNSQERINVA
jgi:hypothetical protein